MTQLANVSTVTCYFKGIKIIMVQSDVSPDLIAERIDLFPVGPDLSTSSLDLITWGLI